MRIFKNRAFNKWMHAEGLNDSTLLKAVEELAQDLYEANLGGNIYKKRIPLGGKGKRGGARVIVAYKFNEITIFIYGFPKKVKDNITDKEKEALKMLAKMYFTYSENELNEMINAGKFIEVMP